MIDQQIVFQSTCPVWGRTKKRKKSQLPSLNFNPPAPCGAGRSLGLRVQAAERISIHLPRVGQDRTSACRRRRRAYFNPPAPCGAGRCPLASKKERRKISIHLPRVEQDYYVVGSGRQPLQFQSTCPVWGRTRRQLYRPSPRAISIHLPRVGQDRVGRIYDRRAMHFNPPAPCGAGQHKFTKNSLVIYATQTNRSVCVRSWQNSICTVLP